MQFSGGTPIGKVKLWLQMHLDEGVRCPCCGQFAKVYRRKINSGMARALVRLYKLGPGYIHHSRLNTHEIAQLRWWDLAEEDELSIGHWRITANGTRFVKGIIAMPKYAEVYDGRLLKLTGDPVSIQEALGSKFDLNELLAS